jgi:hypothetical protein
VLLSVHRRLVVGAAQSFNFDRLHGASAGELGTAAELLSLMTTRTSSVRERIESLR